VFIAARKIIKIEFEEYIYRLRKELRNDFEENENIVIKRKMRASFLEEDITKGIKLGMKLRAKQKKWKIDWYWWFIYIY